MMSIGQLSPCAEDDEEDTRSACLTMLAVRRLSAGKRAPWWHARVLFGERVSRSFVLIPSLYLAGAIVLGLLRGTPALTLYRRRLDTQSCRALALLSSTQLPLVLAITALATAAGRMRPSIAADLVGAALLSTLIFPLLGQRMRRDQPGHDAATAPVTAGFLSLSTDAAHG
jgi:hypothetical protein